MSIETFENEKDKIAFRLENGDANALRKIMNSWEFPDEASAIRFAIAALYITEKGTLYKKELDGSYSLLSPITR